MSWDVKVPDDIVLVKKPDIKRPEFVEAVQQLAKVSTERPKSIIVELNIYRKFLPILLKAYFVMSEGTDKACKQVERCTNIDYDRANKRWSKEEDEELINIVCDGKENIHQISTIFGRSPGAIKTHISELVGRKRLSQEVAGRFIGIIDGIEANAEIKGTIFKES